jgi:hypothetical protein
MNIPLLTTPLFRPSHIVVVWDCKNSIFPLHASHSTHFFLFFCIFYVILLIISEIKLHFSWKNTSKMAMFDPFSPLSGTPEGENFADFRKIYAKIEFRGAGKRGVFSVIFCKLLII